MMETTFETIMYRNNTTTLPAARNAGTDRSGKYDNTMQATSANLGNNAYGKNGTLIAAFSLVLCFCLLSTAGAASIQKRRAIASATESTSSPTKICHQNTPCGWAIYIPFTRRIDYFMRNTCECLPNLACLKTDDDLSVNAYVYRCKHRPDVPTTTDIMPTTM